jgi:hypothetical protein
MKTKTIYAVNSGSYSDYSIDALFSSKELAEDYMAKVKDGDYNDIEEFQLDPPDADFIKRGYSVWSVHMLKDGTTERITHGTDSYDIGNAGSHIIWKRSTAPAYRGKGVLDILISDVWAKTEKHAIKIVNEKRAQMIASGEFV